MQIELEEHEIPEHLRDFFEPVEIPGLKPKDLVGIPWRVAFALQADGWWLRSDVIWSKPNPMPESVRDRPTKAHEYVFLMTKGERYFWDQEAIRERLAETTIERGEVGKYVGRKGIVLPGRTEASSRQGSQYIESPTNPMGHPAGRNIRTVWDIATAPYSGAHFACYPPALVRPMVRASTSERGCCGNCGRPWVRAVERERGPMPKERGGKNYGLSAQGTSPTSALRKVGGDDWYAYVGKETTVGWRPACDCYGTAPWPKLPRKDKDESDEAYQRRTASIRRRRERLMRVYDALETVACRVLDPFVGSGTTLLVAREEGCDGVGLDLSYTYLRDQARKRLELDALDAWENGVQTDDSAPLSELPLFAAGTS